MFEKGLPERKWLAPEEEIQQLMRKKSENSFTEKDEERLFELKQRVEAVDKKTPKEEASKKENGRWPEHPGNYL